MSQKLGGVLFTLGVTYRAGQPVLVTYFGNTRIFRSGISVLRTSSYAKNIYRYQGLRNEGQKKGEKQGKNGKKSVIIVDWVDSSELKNGKKINRIKVGGLGLFREVWLMQGESKV
jgi:hypothetical protein